MDFADDVILAARNLVRTFGDGGSQTTAVDHVSLELFRGQFALLMGPSGSGKSTLLAMLSGLLHPTEGKVLSRDEDRMLDVWSLDDREREKYRLKYCGYIFQGYNLFPALTARQQLEIVLRLGQQHAGPRSPPAVGGDAEHPGTGQQDEPAAGTCRVAKSNASPSAGRW